MGTSNNLEECHWHFGNVRIPNNGLLLHVTAGQLWQQASGRLN